MPCKCFLPRCHIYRVSFSSLVPIPVGSVRVAGGSVPVAEGAVRVAGGSVPVAEGAVRVIEVSVRLPKSLMRFEGKFRRLLGKP